MTLKFAIRNLRKRPFLNLIKIAGLSLALSGILLIVLFLKNELTYDRFHRKSDRIYRFTIANSSSFEGKHFARVYKTGYIPEMAEYFPEIENYVRLAPIRGGVMKHIEDYVEIRQAFICDSTFFEIFDFELLIGNPENILNDPGSMVISESFAEKAFGKTDPVGQILTLPGGQYYDKDIDFTVRGVMKDSPPNSHFHPEIITTPIDKTFLNDWAWTYFLLSENADPGNIVSGFKEFYSSRDEAKKEEIKTEAFLQKIPDIHLHSNKLREIETNKDMSVIYTLSVAALILLLIALANYTNLNIGMAYYSDKYLFISKVSGSSALMTLKYFLSEGIIIAIASIVLCGIIISLANIVIIKNYTLNLFTSNALWALLIVIIFSLFIILAGILPSLKHVISSIKLTSGYNSNNVKRKGISKSIIVLQYTISIMLIAGVIVIRHQTGYALKSSMGVEDNNLICFENVHSDVQKKFEVFKEELLKFNSVRSVSAMLDPPAGEANDMFRFTMEDYINNETEETDNSIGVLPCDYSFASIFNLKFLGGSNFSENNADNEGSGEYIINKTAMHRLNFTDPDEIIGKRFDLIFNAGDIKIPAGAITGVVEDFHLSSIKKEIEPLVMFKRDTLWLLNFIVSLQPGSETKALDDIKSVWTKLFPHYPFQYKYVSSLYQDLYKTELLQSKLLLIFTLIALFICSMGLLGMSLLTAQRRTKEIGLRKINGAGISEIMIMLNLDLVKWITVSIVIAVPFAFFAMSKWLENFAYRTSLSWWIFALAGLTAMLIALLTVSLQSWSAASRNPVEALRYE